SCAVLRNFLRTWLEALSHKASSDSDRLVRETVAQLLAHHGLMPAFDRVKRTRGQKGQSLTRR
ncbi:hypothetical protein N8H74_22340, partial [Pseudomonas sp. B2M1-30]|uniref:hypothetical protein n=1 Tax=Pseudomonas sp. B2M1-30 TaxID=2977324 RepID=UPI0021C8C55A